MLCSALIPVRKVTDPTRPVIDLGDDGKWYACKKDHVSGCTHQGADGWVYFLCTRHFNMVKEQPSSVVLDQNPARGHKPDQPQLDLNNPVHNAWANKEKDNMLIPTWEQLLPMLDFDLIQHQANELYGTNYRMGQNSLVTHHSGQANDGSHIGDVFCGSEYIARITVDKETIIFDRGMEHQELQLKHFLKHEDQDLIDAEADMDRDKYVVVYGHRPMTFRPSEKDVALTLLGRVFTKLKDQHDNNLVEVCGGADGADRWGARAAADNDVTFTIVAPHEGYFDHYHKDKGWTKSLRAAANSITYVHSNDVRFHWSMNFDRNDAMADMGDIFVLVSPYDPEYLLRQRRGGTSHMTKAIKAKGVERIIHVNPRTNIARWVTL